MSRIENRRKLRVHLQTMETRIDELNTRIGALEDALINIMGGYGLADYVPMSGNDAAEIAYNALANNKPCAAHDDYPPSGLCTCSQHMRSRTAR